MAESLRLRLARWLAGDQAAQLAVRARVDDSPGWASLTGRPQDYDPARVVELYSDALAAWRKNPIAWRIIAITTNYVVGDHLRITSPRRDLAGFIERFWNHPQNRMELRLDAMCDELARAGDLFIILFRNPSDGMSYTRFVTKDRIQKIETAPNDWERELVYYEMQESGSPRAWLAAAHPQAAEHDAVMLHYAINRPLGALLGESDLTPMLPWLQRYSRMLEDRVRLHWAVRSFLWLVSVPPSRVREKRAQYARPPEAGSVIVKDDSESWQAVAPDLKAADAGHDLQAVRQMVDAGSGFPPHWRGEGGDANLATATAMQAPTERHLQRRQQYFAFILQDLLYHAYQRAAQAGFARPLKGSDYSQLFTLAVPDISRADNESLARAARDLAGAMQTLSGLLPGRSRTLQGLVLRLAFRFAGEPQAAETIETILKEMEGEQRV